MNLTERVMIFRRVVVSSLSTDCLNKGMKFEILLGIIDEFWFWLEWINGFNFSVTCFWYYCWVGCQACFCLLLGAWFQVMFREISKHYRWVWHEELTTIKWWCSGNSDSDDDLDDKWGFRIGGYDKKVVMVVRRRKTKREKINEKY